MTLIPLTQAPWRRHTHEGDSLSSAWVHPATLAARVDAWLGWLSTQPRGQWLLHQRHPGEFCAALLALWESGQVAVLPADDRPETLARLTRETDGKIPDRLPDIPVSSPTSPGKAPTAKATAVVLYTSGSTGEPVRLPKRFDQLEAELAGHAELWPLSNACVISQVSHQHIYGLLVGILHPLCAGVPFCGDECHYPEALFARLMDAGNAGLAPVVVSSPPQLSRLPPYLAWTKCPAPRHVFSSGAPLSLEHAHDAEKLLRAPVYEIYGSSETGGIAHRRQSQSTYWLALPGVELAFSNERMFLRSAFLEHPGHWWHQPDRIEKKASGFRLLGRADRILKIAGKRVSLDSIEHTLCQLPEVNAVRCVDLGREDGRLGAIIALYNDAIPLQHEQRRLLVQRLRTSLATQLTQVAIPRYWRFVDALPSNAQGKLDRRLIQRLFNDLDNTKVARWLGEHRSSPDVCTLTLEVPERLIFLKGHFEELPLVPGVVMVQWAIEQASECFGNLGTFHSIERLKFQHMLRPGIRFSLTLARHDNGIAFAIDSHDGRHCTGRIQFQAQGNNRE